MRSEYRSGVAMSNVTSETTPLMRRKTVATTVAVRLNDGRAQNRLYTTFAARRPEQYARKTTNNRVASRQRSLHDGWSSTPQRQQTTVSSLHYVRCATTVDGHLRWRNSSVPRPATERLGQNERFVTT